ncbi:hypothetical protein GCM10011490_14560 [Pseudoclavibacter endophyticus]|uniref:Uncharacterized protein n=1 Tax=Pseudoclavibacter endophyticus TaxID=1778590 RepID=A0A6H9WDX3_9MICO|nr:hypothetical protein [Pseudoclavibacter endophyticus]KAB1649152.1 hypothetical protein F8O04_02395 [Pseudoclavibacter endophyticus]GGA65015.1 hypothetical protein GCM10011490_14560 [Pseudoclavibacter endophyticus]
MKSRRAVVVGVTALATASLLAGCSAGVITMVTPPGWGNSTTEAAPPPSGPAREEVLSASVPSMCGVPGGDLDDGVLQIDPSAVALGDGAGEPMATGLRVAHDPATDEPIIAVAERNDGAIGAAAVFTCVYDGTASSDRVVVWDAGLEPIGVIDLAPLRGLGPVVGQAIAITGETARVAFQEIGDGTADAPAGAELRVPLTVTDQRLVVGALTLGE